MMLWTNEQRDMVRTMWKNGAAARMIANELGVTRNAVIGVAHRMGLSRPRPEKPPVVPIVARPRPFRIRSRMQRPTVVVDVAPAHGLTIIDLSDDQCRWPVGDTSPQVFCGAHTRQFPYCPAHQRRAWRNEEANVVVDRRA